MKVRYMLVSMLVLLSLVMAACQPAATTEAPAAQSTATEAMEEPTAEATEAMEEPTAEATDAAAEPTATEAAAASGEDPCATDAFGCAEIASGETIKIGMGAPMTGDNAQFGVDISQGAMLAVADAGELEGFTYELVVEDDGGTPEGGAAVANKLVSDPTEQNGHPSTRPDLAFIALWRSYISSK